MPNGYKHGARPCDDCQLVEVAHRKKNEFNSDGGNAESQRDENRTLDFSGQRISVIKRLHECRGEQRNHRQHRKQLYLGKVGSIATREP